MVMYMGVVIFTKDDKPFMVGNYILMVGKIDTSLSGKDTTYILRTDRFNEAEVKKWLPFIENRLVVCIEKAPKISKDIQDHVIIDSSLQKPNDKTLLNSVVAMLSWPDRKRVWHQIQGLPIPYALAFLRVNRDDINLWRRIALNNMEVDDDFITAIFAYGVEPDRKKTVWPKKAKAVDEAPAPFRQNDEHWRMIVDNDVLVANEIRRTASQLPKGMKKTVEKVNTWL